MSVHVGRHLICEYLKQSIIRDPTFIALQDYPSNIYVEDIRDALQESKGNCGAVYKCLAWHCNEGNRDALPSGKKAALLYNERALICDKEKALAKNDFFNGRDTKSDNLFKRLDGGLFSS